MIDTPRGDYIFSNLCISASEWIESYSEFGRGTSSSLLSSVYGSSVVYDTS